MRRIFALQASLVFMALALASQAVAQPYGYAVNSDGFQVPEEQIDNLYQINLSTGEAVRIGPTGFLDIEGLAFSATGELYGADDESNTLLSLDTHTATTTAIGGLNGNLRLPAAQVLDFGLSFTCDALYASSDNLSTLYRLDLDSGEAILVGTTSVAITGLAALGDTLYGIGAGEIAPSLYRVDPETATATLIGALGSAAAPYVDAGLDFDDQGRLWAITDRRNVNNESYPSQVLQIDITTGRATLMAETLYGVESLAIGPVQGCAPDGGMNGAAPIPTLTPGMLGMAAGMLFILGLVTLRRRNKR